MKKSLILAGMLAIGFAYAQEGNVGINTQKPQATLDIKPNAINSAATATTNEGLLIPRLGKSRVALMVTPEKSTLVYVNNTAYIPENDTTPTAKDQRVAEINVEGFYHYNGTKWVKHIDGNGTDLLWEKETTTSNIRLKETISGDNHIFYNPQGGLNIIPKTLRPSTSTLLMDKYYANSTNLKIAYADKLKGSDAGLNQWGQAIQSLNINKVIIDEHNNTSSFNTVITEDNSIDITENSTKNYFTLTADRNSVYNNGKGSIINQIGSYNVTGVSNGSIEARMTSTYNETIAAGNFSINNMNGTYNLLRLSEGVSTSKIGAISASENHIGVSKDALYPVETLSGTYTHFYYLPADYQGSINKLFGSWINFGGIGDTDKINENVGLYINNVTKGKNKNYGLLIDNVGKAGATENYAIYTNAGKVRFGDNVGVGVDTPNEKLEVAGAIKVSNTTSTCSDANRGTIKFVNDNFYGCKSTGWVLLNN